MPRKKKIEETIDTKNELTYKVLRLNFDEIAKWTDSTNNDFPVYGIISFLKACGAHQIVSENKELFEEDGSFNTTFFVNAYTLMHIKNVIKHNWQIHSFNITEEGVLEWNTEKYPKGATHYEKTLTSRMESAIAYNFMEYKFGINDDLPDDVLEIRLPVSEITDANVVIEQEASQESDASQN